MIEGGMKHVEENYNFQDFEKSWVDLMYKMHGQHGSWKNRKNYRAWEKIVL